MNPSQFETSASSSPEPPMANAPGELTEQGLVKAEAYMDSGLVFEADEIFEGYLESQWAPRARMGLAKCAFFKRDLHESLAHLQILSRLDPHYPDLHNTMATVLFGLGLVDDAREMFVEAIKADPELTIPWRNLAELELRSGHREACEAACHQILQMEPDDEEALDMLQRASELEPSAPPQPAMVQAKDAVAKVLAEMEAPSSTGIEQAAPPPAASSAAAPQPAGAEQVKEKVQMGPIEGVKSVPLTAHVDDRGYLIEILRCTDEHFTKFGQVYLVGDVKAGTIRAYHKHEELWDWFFISHGVAKFVLVDDRPDSSTYGNMQIVVTGDRNPAVVVVPPGVYHGWMALSDDTQLISTASEVYNREKPDEVRIPPDSYGDVWDVKGR